MKIICTGYAQWQEAIQTYQHYNFGGFQKLRIKLYLKPKIICIPFFSFNITILFLKLIFSHRVLIEKIYFCIYHLILVLEKVHPQYILKKLQKRKGNKKR